MCDETQLGDDNKITLIREQLMSKIHIINRQFAQMGLPEIFAHLLLAQSTDLALYFAIFLDILYNLIDEYAIL